MRVSYGLIALCACVFSLRVKRHDSCKRPQNVPTFPRFIPPHPLSSSQSGMLEWWRPLRSAALRKNQLVSYRGSQSIKASSCDLVHAHTSNLQGAWLKWHQTIEDVEPEQYCSLHTVVYQEVKRSDIITSLHTILYSWTRRPPSYPVFDIDHPHLKKVIVTIAVQGCQHSVPVQSFT